ncbi:alpha/beta fold hydrolase [Thalassospira profundimaris]|uniref:alpha/beta fold hydrolase n=1 Tax=Thalassospira profundimaris TaxID=502049 RepID=UPI0002873E43|nr:alpha/beta hydrolase [Thalassospira profundimaris]EKF09844.1 alpha/beta hydrolase fold domain-containing protein [Thalassospira profundimaris WP0211]
MKPVANDHVLMNNTRIAHGVYGDGVPVILLHGTPSSSLIWRDSIEPLVTAGYKVHLFDLLGYGLSERPWDPEIDTSISGQLPILEGLMDHWGLTSAHIVGHDFGGAIAQQVGVFRPDVARTITLIDAVSYDSYPSKRTRQQMEAGLDVLAKAPDAEHRAHFRDWVKSAVVDQKRFEGTALETYVDYISGPIGQASLFQHQIRQYDPIHTMKVADRLGELGTKPVKLIWGAQDAWQTPDWAKRLHGDIPGSELSLVEGAAHFALEDKPDEINALILDFLSRHRDA